MKKRKPNNPAKFDRCVKAVKAKGSAADPYAVCTAAGTRNPRSRRNPPMNFAWPKRATAWIDRKIEERKEAEEAGRPNKRILFRSSLLRVSLQATFNPQKLLKSS